jgi:4-hydroxy-tetrahydrodipicolinate reductase
MRVAIIGSEGKMGRAVVAAVRGAEGLELGATLDVGDELDEVAGSDVAVIFTSPDAVMSAIHACIDAQVHCVVGTTGITPNHLDQISSWCAESSTNVLVVPNFAIGAVLMMAFAQQAAPYFSGVEIIEEHHPEKVDAPSGTALRTAELIAAARQNRAQPPDATNQGHPEARGANIGGVRVHSIRMDGLVAHQTVQFGNPGELLTIRHDSTDRSSFMPGVVLAVQAVKDLPGVTVGLETVLGLP